MVTEREEKRVIEILLNTFFNLVAEEYDVWGSGKAEQQRWYGHPVILGNSDFDRSADQLDDVRDNSERRIFNQQNVNSLSYIIRRKKGRPLRIRQTLCDEILKER